MQASNGNHMGFRHVVRTCNGGFGVQKIIADVFLANKTVTIVSLRRSPENIINSVCGVTGPCRHFHDRLQISFQDVSGNRSFMNLSGFMSYDYDVSMC